MSYVEPFDLWNILVNTFAGGIEIFCFIFVIFLAILGAKFQMSNYVFLILLALFGVIMGNFIGIGFYLVILLIVAFAIYSAFNKIIR